MEIKELQSIIETRNAEMKAAYEEIRENAEKGLQGNKKTAEDLGKIQGELKSATERLLELEQKAVKPVVTEAHSVKSIVQLISEDESFDAIKSGRSKSTGKISIPQGFKAATGVITTNTPYPSLPQRVPGIVAGTDATIGNLVNVFTQGRTTSNAIQFVREDASRADLKAAIAPENTLKKQSKLDMTLETATVATVAHWILASKQVLDDTAQLESYIAGRLIYGLEIEEDNQILNGDGTNGSIKGIMAQAVPASFPGDTLLDSLLYAAAEIRTTGVQPDAIICNPMDFAKLMATKDTIGSYMLISPTSNSTPNIFGLPVVVSSECPLGTYVVGAFKQAGTLFMREDATVELSREDRDNFVKNMVTILAEERYALAIYLPHFMRTVTAPTAPATGGTKSKAV